MAVKVDGNYPIHAISRFTNILSIKLKSIKKSYDSQTCLAGYETFEFCEIISLSDFLDATDPNAPCSLIKAALITLGIKDLITKTIQDSEEFFGNKNSPESFSFALNKLYSAGLEIAGISGLPSGSGMGGSSVLAAAVLASLSCLLEIHVTNELLVYLVSHVEQIMTTGGGWQDQVSTSISFIHYDNNTLFHI